MGGFSPSHSGRGGNRRQMVSDRRVKRLGVVIGAIDDIALLSDLLTGLAVRVDEVTVGCVCIYLPTYLCIFYDFSDGGSSV